MMDMNKTISFEPEAEELFNKVLESWPRIIRSLWDKRLRTISQLVAASKGEKKISESSIMESLNIWPFTNNRWLIFGSLADRGVIKGDGKGRMPKINGELPKAGFWSSLKSGERLKKKPEEIKVLGILSSPRLNGNTDILLSEILKGASEKGANVEKVCIARMDIKFCTGCEACRKEKLPQFCVLKDDMTAGLYRKFLDADIYVIGFPIYTGRENAPLANFFDRFYGVGLGRFPWMWKDEEKKRGALVVTWGAPYPAFERTVENHCDLLAWYGIEVREAVYAWGCHERGEIAKDKKGLEMAYQAGERLVT